MPKNVGFNQWTSNHSTNKKRQLAAARFGFSGRSSNWPGRLAVLALLNLATLPSLSIGGESVIKVTRFQVPSQARPGEYRSLSCLYELHGATLHAMKLFKDDKEFYRYTPSAPKMAFPVAGVQVDLAHSNEHEVWFRISKRSAGLYKCQVSIEGTFNSVSAEKRMDIAEATPPSTNTVGGNWHRQSSHHQQHQQQQDLLRHNQIIGANGRQNSQRNSQNVQQQHLLQVAGSHQYAPSTSHQRHTSSTASRHTPKTLELSLPLGLAAGVCVIIHYALGCNLAPMRQFHIRPPVGLLQ